jgi:hypothetical protein
MRVMPQHRHLLAKVISALVHVSIAPLLCAVVLFFWHLDCKDVGFIVALIYFIRDVTSRIGDGASPKNVPNTREKNKGHDKKKSKTEWASKRD